MKRGILLLILLCMLSFISVAADFDGENIFGINNREGSIVMINEQGEYLELTNTLFADWVDLTTADVDGDDLDEIVALRDFSSALYIYDFDGGELVLKEKAENIGDFSRDLDWVGVEDFDFDNDGKEELLLLNNKYGRFYMVDYEGDTFYVKYLGDSELKDWEGFDIGKIDGEIKIFALRQEKFPITVYNYEGKINDENSFKIGDQIGNNPLTDITLFDIDGDGINEIIVFSDGTFYVGKLENGFFNMQLKEESNYRDLLRLESGDLSGSGEKKLITLRNFKIPFSYYNYRPDSLIEKAINYGNDLQWKGFSVGDIGYSGDSPEPVVEEEPEQPVVEEEPEQPVVEEEPEPEEKEEKSYLWVWLIIALIIGGGAGTGIFFYLKSRKEEDYEDIFYEKVDDELKKKKPKKTEEKKSEKKEEKEKKYEEDGDLWPKLKTSDGLEELKKLVKKRKKK